MAFPRLSRTGRSIASAALALALIAATGIVQPAWSQTREIKQAFPRLAGIQIGRNPYPKKHNDPEYARQIAKLDVAVLSQFAQDETALSIKQLNPDILLGRYTNIVEVFQGACCDHEIWRDKLARERGPNPDVHPDWYVRTPNTGERIEVWPGTWRVNITDYVRPDSNGDTWVDYRVKYDYQTWFKNEVWDIWYSDVVDHQPRWRDKSGTYSGDRATQLEEIAAYRRAHRRHWDGIYAARPGTIVMVNYNWHRYQESQGKFDLDVYNKGVQAGLFEHAMRSPPRPGSKWELTYKWYRWSESYLKDPPLLIFHVQGPRDDYQFVRYSFATALMGNGFYKFSPNDEYYFGTVEWFDEFDLAGTADTSWLGLAITPPPEKPWQNGVYRRDFENGIALVNSHNNDPQTVTIGADENLRRFLGKQDPAVNNGQPARQITLKAGDGILLVRERGKGLPPPPSAPRLRIDASD